MKQNQVKLSSIKDLLITNPLLDLKKSQEKIKANEAKPANPTIKQWKEYLKSDGKYTGDVNSPDIDNDFKTAMINAESALSNDVPSIKGLIWTGNSINPAISITDYQQALKLLIEKKKPNSEKESTSQKTSSRIEILKKMAHATMDAIGPITEAMQDAPNATKMQKDPGAAAAETGNPETSPIQNVMINKLPQKKQKQEDKLLQNKPNIDDRMLQLVDLIEKTQH
jgi:citrate synthase